MPLNYGLTDRLSEKTIELTLCSQLSFNLCRNMVWFGLTQAMEQENGYDAAVELGDQAFVLQFKASSTVPIKGSYPGMRRFSCQHHQMQTLVTIFKDQEHCCFYLLPNIGTYQDLLDKDGDLYGNSYLLDVSQIDDPVPPTHRANGYHYAYLDSSVPGVTITSKKFYPKKFYKTSDIIGLNGVQSSRPPFQPVKKVDGLLRSSLAQRLSYKSKFFYRNAVMGIILKK